MYDVRAAERMKEPFSASPTLGHHRGPGGGRVPSPPFSQLRLPCAEVDVGTFDTHQASLSPPGISEGP